MVCVAGIFLVGCFFTPFPNSLMAIAEPVNVTKTETDISKLQQHDVVYLGETHDSSTAHQRQLEIITQLQEKLFGGERELAIAERTWKVIALEMFQRPFQPILDRYLAGTITEEQLRKQTEYDTRWGFDWEFYAPILRFAKDQQIPLIALNTPSEITQKVAKSGINSLEAQDWRYIPPLEEIKLDNEEYRQKITEIYQNHAAQGHGNSTDADNFFAAQVLWDETMAEAIALYYQNHPKSQIIVLVGQAHVMDDYAIPDRVNRRINDPNFTQTVVILE